MCYINLKSEVCKKNLPNLIMDWRRNNLFSNSFLMCYGSALVFVISALLVTLPLWSLVKPLGSPLFLVAIMGSAWWSGFRSGLFATVLSGVTVDYIFISPEYQFVGNWDDILRLSVFVAEGVVLSWLIDTRRIATEKLEKSHEQLQDLSQHQQTLRETEQKRIALEIHDELGQSLTGMKMDVHWLKRQINQSADNLSENSIPDKLSELSQQIDSTISSVRRIATELRPAVLDDFGLIAAIEWQAQEFERKTDVPCLFKSNEEEFDLDAESSTAVFRIFQETLTNITRHANASTIKVSFETSNEQVLMRVEDNGKGIDLDKIKNKKSLGILGMHERARLIGGELNIFKRNSGGTTVELAIPKRGFN